MDGQIWPEQIGISGQIKSESMAGLGRNMQKTFNDDYLFLRNTPWPRDNRKFPVNTCQHLHFVTFISFSLFLMWFIFGVLLNKLQSEQVYFSLFFSREMAASPVRLIDVLLQDTFLFVMEVNHDKALVRDEAFYHRGCALVEQVKLRLDNMKESEEFVRHVQYAQCGLLDHMVMNSVPDADNRVWRRAPLEGAYLGTLRAGEIIPDNLRKLLRQTAPDMRLLTLFQRIYAFGFGRFLGGYEDERRQAMESFKALVPASELPQFFPLIVERRPGVRRGLLRSRLLHVVVVAALVISLYCGLDDLLHHYLLTSLSG